MILGGFLILPGCGAIPRAMIYTDPLSPEEHVQLAAAYMNQGSVDLARKEYKSALQKQKRNVPALIGLGNLAFEREDWRTAQKYYRQALHISPGNPGASNNLAMIYLKKGTHLNEAEGLIQKSLQSAGPLKPYLLDTLVNLYLQEGRVDEARSTFEQVRVEKPKDNPSFEEQFGRTSQKVAATAP